MNKYLIKATYNSNGIKGLIQEGGSVRRASIEKMAQEMGGKIESFYYALGGEDAYIIAEIPDDISTTTIGLTVNASGLVKVSMTALLTPSDIDAASKKSIVYRAPGKE